MNTFTIALVASLISHESYWKVLLITAVAVVIELLINAFVAFTVAKILPKKCFDNNKKLYKVSSKEVKIYEFFKIKKWKDKIWELGKTNGFSKSKVDDPKNPEYIARFIEESNIGILDHLCSIFFGFLVVLCVPVRFMLTIGCPVGFVSLFLNLLPIAVLRYNKVKLERIYNHLSSKTAEVNNGK